jgi:hypothetical protein
LLKNSILSSAFWVAQRFTAAIANLASMSALQFAEKLDFVFCFWVAQRFTAAIKGLS